MTGGLKRIYGIFSKGRKRCKTEHLLFQWMTRLNTNITQNEGIEIVCSAYEKFYEATHLFLHITWEKLNA